TKRLLQDAEVARETEGNWRLVGSTHMLCDGGITVRFVKRPEPARHVTLPHVHVLQSVTDEEIVQNRHAGDVLQEAKYMLVEVRIADVVEHAVVPFGIRAEPF